MSETVKRRENRTIAHFWVKIEHSAASMRPKPCRKYGKIDQSACRRPRSREKPAILDVDDGRCWENPSTRGRRRPRSREEPGILDVDDSRWWENPSMLDDDVSNGGVRPGLPTCWTGRPPACAPRSSLGPRWRALGLAGRDAREAGCWVGVVAGEAEAEGAAPGRRRPGRRQPKVESPIGLGGRGATVSVVLPIGYIRRAAAWGKGLVDFSCRALE